MLNWFGERREGANQLVESWCMKIGEYQLILPLFADRKKHSVYPIITPFLLLWTNRTDCITVVAVIRHYPIHSTIRVEGVSSVLRTI